MIEYIVIGLMLICNLVIFIEWGKYGFWGTAIQQPRNHKAYGAAFIGCLVFLLSGLLQKYGNIQFRFLTQDNFWPMTGILLGIPVTVFLLLRLIMPAGVFDYNRAVIRTTFWTGRHYQPGRSLPEVAEMLRNFPLAQRTLHFFKRSIKAQERGTKMVVNNYAQERIDTFRQVTPFNKKNIATAYEEMALLYRMMNLFDEAHDALRKSETVIEGLLRSDPDNKDYLKTKSLIIFRIAEAYQAQGVNIPEARRIYQECLVIDEKIGDTRDSGLVERLISELRD